MKNQAIFITSWPMTLGQGSGTALFVPLCKKPSKPMDLMLR